MAENRFDYDGKEWIWTRTDGSKVRLTGADVGDLAQLTHSASRMSNPGPGGYVKSDGEYSFSGD